MKILHCFISLCLMFGSVHAQSSLPACKGSDSFRWSNCFGTRAVPNSVIKYIGEFKDGKFHGQGTFYYTGGGKYVGEFKDGKPHGQGTLTDGGGITYIGEWRHNMRNGRGIEYSANGTVLRSGQWADDELVLSSSSAAVQRSAPSMTQSCPIFLGGVISLDSILLHGGVVTASNEFSTYVSICGTSLKCGDWFKDGTLFCQ